MRSPSGSTFAASSSASAHQAANASASAKNASTFSCETPGAPLRSTTEPAHAMTSSIAFASHGSSEDVAGTMPSPLNLVAAKTFAVSVVSSSEISSAPFLSRFARIRFADESSRLPSSLLPSMAASGSEGSRLSRLSGLLSTEPTHLMAARISGARMRPSLSVSISESVFSSNSRPWIGQPSATQSF